MVSTGVPVEMGKSRYVPNGRTAGKAPYGVFAAFPSGLGQTLK